MLVPREWITTYRARLLPNVAALPLYERTVQLDWYSTVEIIRIIRPGIEREYKWFMQWGAIPHGPEFDDLIEQAVADVRASRAPGEPETFPERRLLRVQPNPPKEVEEMELEREREKKDAAPARRQQQAGLMRGLRAFTKFVLGE